MDYSFIQAAKLDAQLRHLMRWKIILLHLQPNFLRCSYIENISALTYIILKSSKKSTKIGCYHIFHFQRLLLFSGLSLLKKFIVKLPKFYQHSLRFFDQREHYYPHIIIPLFFLSKIGHLSTPPHHISLHMIIHADYEVLLYTFHSENTLFINSHFDEIH